MTQYWTKRVEFAQSARKHKIGRARVRHVLCDPVAVFTVPSPDGQTPDRLLYLGHDHTGRPLEVVTVAVGDGELVVYAMDLRTKYGRGARRRRRWPPMKDPDDYDPAVDEPLLDPRGNLVTADYVERLADEAEAGYDLEALPPPKVGRPSLSESGSSPQVRFRVSERTRHEALALAKREGKTVSQLARVALESYLAAHRVAPGQRGEMA